MIKIKFPNAQRNTSKYLSRAVVLAGWCGSWEFCHAAELNLAPRSIFYDSTEVFWSPNSLEVILQDSCVPVGAAL